MVSCAIHGLCVHAKRGGPRRERAAYSTRWQAFSGQTAAPPTTPGAREPLQAALQRTYSARHVWQGFERATWLASGPGTATGDQVIRENGEPGPKHRQRFLSVRPGGWCRTPVNSSAAVVRGRSPALDGGPRRQGTSPPEVSSLSYLLTYLPFEVIRSCCHHHLPPLQGFRRPFERARHAHAPPTARRRRETLERRRRRSRAALLP